MKFVFSPDVILCGWLGLKHQLTNSCARAQNKIGHPAHLYKQLMQIPVLFTTTMYFKCAKFHLCNVCLILTTRGVGGSDDEFHFCDVRAHTLDLGKATKNYSYTRHTKIEVKTSQITGSKLTTSGNWSSQSWRLRRRSHQSRKLSWWFVSSR